MRSSGKCHSCVGGNPKNPNKFDHLLQKLAIFILLITGFPPIRGNDIIQRKKYESITDNSKTS